LFYLWLTRGKVENIYFGDGLKFNSQTYAPPVPEETQMEYREGPELTEVTDPTVEEEQAWLAKLQVTTRYNMLQNPIVFYHLFIFSKLQLRNANAKCILLFYSAG